jgi:osmotically-inducible protein OsmY
MWRILPLLPLLLLLVGCKTRDGDTLRKVARKSGEKIQHAAAPMNDAAPSWHRLGEPSLAGRVDNRIRHDRYLAGHRFDVRGDGPGTVAVKGTVPEASVKTRALDLARSTLGVEKVIDEVTVKAE